MRASELVPVNSLDSIFELLASHPNLHARDTDFYQALALSSRESFAVAKEVFRRRDAVVVGELGPVTLPYLSMGSVDSLDLFGLDELILFAFYYRTRGIYSHAADIGANIGLHSILLSRCCKAVESYEPDPKHFVRLVENLGLNGVTNVRPVCAAVSNATGKTEFVRVLGNTTSSHIAGAKRAPYGDLERFEVNVVGIDEIAKRADFLKIDAEGEEATILTALPLSVWNRIDAIVEIGTDENAHAIFEKFEHTPVRLFSQKRGWGKVDSLGDMPTSYKDGGLFLTTKVVMPW